MADFLYAVKSSFKNSLLWEDQDTKKSTLTIYTLLAQTQIDIQTYIINLEKLPNISV